MTLSTVLLSLSALCAGLAQCSSHMPLGLFPFEKVQLEPTGVAGSRVRFHADDTPPASATTAKCKAFPGGTDWPHDDAWKELASVLNGTLLRPAPVASVCYNGTAYANFNATSCANIVRGWATEFIRCVGGEQSWKDGCEDGHLTPQDGPSHRGRVAHV